MQLIRMVVIPALDLMLHMAALEPLVTQHARDFTVSKPLCPGRMVVVDTRQRQGAFTFQNDTWPSRVERRAELGCTLVHRVQKDAIGVDRRDEVCQCLQIAATFAPRAGVPRVVVDEDAHATRMAATTQIAQARQTAGHVPIEVKLIPLVDADPRIGVPQYQTVVATEVMPAFVEERFQLIDACVRIVEPLVAHHQKTAGVRRGRPGELRLAIERVVIAQPPSRLVTPRPQLFAEDRPERCVGGCRDDLQVGPERKPDILAGRLLSTRGDHGRHGSSQRAEKIAARRVQLVGLPKDRHEPRSQLAGLSAAASSGAGSRTSSTGVDSSLPWCSSAGASSFVRL